MMSATQISEYVFYAFLIIAAGLAEYVKIAPSGTFLPLLTLIVGHYLGNVPTKSAIVQNTLATKENTIATEKSIGV
jgi:hypothetical protein